MYDYEAHNDYYFKFADMSNKYNDNEKLCNWLLSFCKDGYRANTDDSSSSHTFSPYEEKILAREFSFLEKMPGDVIEDDDTDYPESIKTFLGDNRPKVLFYMGEKSIMAKLSIMVCGAREASEKGCEIAFECGKQIAQAGLSVASGYARGVDRAAHKGALEAGGDTMAVLPYGLSRFRVHRNIAEVFDPGRFIAVSEVPPSFGFSVKNAFRRNKFLAAVAEAVIVVEPGESGGTWFSAEGAYKMKRPLFYFEGERPGVRERMNSLGGIRLELNDGVPDLSPVYEQCIR